MVDAEERLIVVIFSMSFSFYNRIRLKNRNIKSKLYVDDIKDNAVEFKVFFFVSFLCIRLFRELSLTFPFLYLSFP